ncbi:tyrosine-type recombinase/integrase [Sanguibacter massiliensis]|uniref:tyrosine-type recombinase/integrase n=1 Tax=Sanguibacter massiliensis TaxID=1973217 RepID=UPI000C82D688|nr:tyrosine-type recombinase/integrase [Sanguibacter massiliensis]
MEPTPEAHRDLGMLALPSIGRVYTDTDRHPSSTVVLPDDDATAACVAYLMEVHARHRASTVRSYAFGLLRWFRFLAAVGVAWDRATPTDARDFVIWMRHTTKTGGAKNPSKRNPRVSRNAQTGKPYLGTQFRPATINHNETVVHEFYEFHRRSGAILLNPVLRGCPDERAGAHHNPLQARRGGRRAGSRQAAPRRLPRSMPDEAYDRFFEALRSDRDRALVAMYVSSGARPSEILGLRVGDVDAPRCLITVVRKGGLEQTIPVSTEAIAWLRRYEEDLGWGAPDEPLWVTRRGVARPLTYDALRAVFRRANEVHATNWTPHDLRHTAATRMLQGGTSPRVVQEILGHAHLHTLSGYTVPRLEEMVAAVRATSQPRPEPAFMYEESYDPSDLAVLFGGR